MVSDRLLHSLLALFAALAAGLLLLVVGFIAQEALGLLQQLGVGAFLFHGEWQPYAGRFGLLPMLLTSLLLMLGAVAIATPLAVVGAACINFYLGRHSAILARRLVEIAAGIPSVVYGLWGLTLLVPLLAAIKQPGASLLAGMMVLALMILPTIVVVVDAGLRALPTHYRENAEALAIRRSGFVFAIALPAVRGSVITGATLAAARAIGETMVVMMVTGNLVQLPGSLFDPVRALTANIALEMAYAMDEHRSALYVSSLFLLLFAVALVLTNQLLLGWRGRHG